MSRIVIEYGALAPPLHKQLGVRRTHELDYLQQDADAISRLVIRRLLSEKEAQRARLRLRVRISSWLSENAIEGHIVP